MVRRGAGQGDDPARAQAVRGYYGDGTSGMTFDRGWVLAIAWLPLAWAAWEWTRTRRRLALTLKCLALVAILLALAEPKLRIQETKVALAVLVDTSASVSPAD